MLNIFSCAFGHLHIFFRKCLFRSSVHFMIGLFGFVFLYVKLYELLIYFECWHIVSIFSHSIGYSAILLTVSFAIQNLLSLSNSHLFTSAFILLPWETDLRKYSYYRCLRMLPMLSSKTYGVIFYLWSLNHLVHIFIYGVKKSSNFIALHITV